MALHFQLKNTKIRNFSRKTVKEWLTEIIRNEGYRLGTLHLVLTTDEELLRLNREYLDKEYMTDVIAFDYSERKVVNGEVFISAERVRENANHFGVSFLNELFRVMAHGVLHLVGYNDETEEGEKMMRGMEDFYLSKVDTGD